MSLLTDFARPCVLMIKDPQPDGEGGYITVWTEGAEFLNYQALDTSMEARIAEKQGVHSVYSALVDQGFPIGYGDHYKDLQTGATYRVTSNPEDKQSPKSSGMHLKYFTSERVTLA